MPDAASVMLYAQVLLNLTRKIESVRFENFQTSDDTHSE